MLRIVIGRNGTIKKTVRKSKEKTEEKKQPEPKLEQPILHSPLRISSGSSMSFPIRDNRPCSEKSNSTFTLPTFPEPQIPTETQEKKLQSQFNEYTELILKSPALSELRKSIQSLSSSGNSIMIHWEVLEEPVQTIHYLNKITKDYLSLLPISMEKTSDTLPSTLVNFIKFLEDRDALAKEMAEKYQIMEEQNTIFRDILASKSIDPDTHFTFHIHRPEKAFDPTKMESQETLVDDIVTMGPVNISVGPDEKIPEYATAGVQACLIDESQLLDLKAQLSKQMEMHCKIQEENDYQITLLKRKLNDEASTLSSTRTLLNEKDSQLSNMLSQNSKLQENYTKLLDYRQSQDVLVDELKEKIHGLNIQIANSEKIHQESLSKYQDLQQKLESARAEVSQLLEDRDKAMSHSDKLVHEIQTLQQSLSQVTNELQTRLQQYKNEKTNAEKWQKEHGALEQKMAGYQETNRDLKITIRKLEAQVEQQGHVIDQLRSAQEQMMKFPELMDNQANLLDNIISEDYDRHLMEYIDVNNERMIMLEKKNEELRYLRTKHAELSAVDVHLPSMGQKLLWDPSKSKKVQQWLSGEKMNEPNERFNASFVSKSVSQLEKTSGMNEPFNASKSVSQLEKTNQPYFFSGMDSDTVTRSVQPRKSCLSAGRSRSSTAKSVRWGSPETFANF